MKKYLFFLALAMITLAEVNAQVEYKIVTTVESIIPSGLGRSRIIEEKDDISAADNTTTRTDGTSSDQGNVSRKGLKIDVFEETKLLNFFNLGGINFQNIASNDALVSDKLNQLAAEGWTLAFVTSGVESSAGGDDGEGIFVTRYIFKR